ncbi:tryptophan synthase subunit alpha [Sulfuriferula sp. AH1]|uniref:tryptophan synthase subunit alpha n=1 Tax=Sulfuriferula sp. AH1 TaxID=1985873 RepID=UPI000B3B0B28|nr:tryptophan synthase subunit alpha [Sulfuriferula sp. AH1]ARU30740.1 tryptophan synthase subunit alpha [Sulfuriferula sp. AH1]
MSRIKQTFAQLNAQHKAALIPFITAGDPDPQLTVQILHGLAAAGADIIELGVPFSDPMADGPTIQRASERALKHHVGLKDVLAMVTEFRATNTTTPIVLMGYANPIEHMGYAVFAQAAAAAGVDGVLTVDIPPEESVAEIFMAAGIDTIFLLSPTTPDARINLVASKASGFVYYVSLKGVTGSANLDLAEVAGHIPVIRERCGLPVGVGFGIRDAQTAAAIAKFADAVVIGSRIVEEIENSPREQVVANLTTFVAGVRAAMDVTA